MSLRGTPALQLVTAWRVGHAIRIQGVERALASVRFLVLGGGTGCGKTSAAVWFLGQDGGSFVPAVRLAVEPELFTSLLSASTLVLDDLGSEGKVAWIRERIAALVCQQYDAGRRILITTNLNQTQLATAYGDRLLDRLTGDRGLYAEVPLESLRQPRSR